MQPKRIVSIFFSPNGTTRTVTEAFCGAFPVPVEVLDLLASPPKKEVSLSPDDLAVVGMPVYAGRIPPICREMLGCLNGSGTPAVALAVYGNRDYDDALLELADLLEAARFSVIGAGAFIAQHSIFPRVGAGRPDAEDRKAIAAFAEKCGENLARFAPEHWKRPAIKGNPDYNEPGAVPLKPSADKSCISCGKCAAICPTHSIPAGHPDETDKGTCISCGACIRVCPVGARAFRGLVYQMAEKKFYKDNAAYRKPEVFY